MRRGDLSALHELRRIGQWLIGPRTAKGGSLSDRADALGVSVQQVSRDESNQYQDISTERAQRILDALGVRFRLEVEEPIPQDSNDQKAVPASRKGRKERS
jgi:transcriptional regulator with XRE-family HTH domain